MTMDYGLRKFILYEYIGVDNFVIPSKGAYNDPDVYVR